MVGRYDVGDGRCRRRGSHLDRSLDRLGRQLLDLAFLEILLGLLFVVVIFVVVIVVRIVVIVIVIVVAIV